MKNLTTGQFYGVTNTTTQLDGLTLTDTEYTLDKVDWHYHENAYFTFILNGRVMEGSKKETYHCEAGSLLFHNWQEAHYNIKPKGFTRGFHIELNEQWLDTYNVSREIVQGSVNLKAPELKGMMYDIFKETKLGNAAINIDSLLLRLFSRMGGIAETFSSKAPAWVKQIRDVLNDAPAHNWTLTQLATMVNIHPIHLSRGFARYFNCNLGDYIRMIRVQRSLALLFSNEYSLTDIALACGFADQSHFIRSFKSINHITPSQYKKLISA